MFNKVFLVTILLLCATVLARVKVPRSVEKGPAPIRMVLQSPQLKRDLPMIRIGTTHIDFGPEIGWGGLLKDVWQLFLAKGLTYNINGTTYGLQLISYLDDESDFNTTKALVATLVNVDKVHILITAWEGDTVGAFIPAAEAAGIPCISIGAYELSYYPSSLFYWTVNTLPSVVNLGHECAVPLAKAGAKTFAIVTAASTWTDPTSQNAPFIPLLIQRMEEVNLTYTGMPYNISDDAFLGKPHLMDPVFAQLKILKPDVICAEFGQANNIIFIRRMRENNYNPPAYFIYGTGSYPEVRYNLTWMDAGSLISEAYEADLNSPDPIWGTSLEYDALMNSTYGTQSTNADSNLASALTILDDALKRTNDLSPASLRAAIIAFNGTTIVGSLSFTNNTVNRLLYCFQNNFPNASGINTVWPDTVNVYSPIVYPAVVSYPKDYFKHLHPSANHTLRNVLIIIFSVLVGLLIIGGLIFLVMWKKYHFIFVPKEDIKEEWAAS